MTDEDSPSTTSWLCLGWLKIRFFYSLVGQYKTIMGVTMFYEAKSNGDGTYEVSANGTVVATKARARKVAFSHVTTHHLHGSVHHLAGPCIATVPVPGVGEVAATVVA